MRNITKNTFIILLYSFLFTGCNTQQQSNFKAKEIYKSDQLIITQISENSFIHTSFKQTNDFGNVPCNGLIVKVADETIVFDTPTNDKGSEELIQWINKTLHSKINAIIPTHFHDDSLGGLQAFHNHHISSYAYSKTIDLARENNFTVPENSFSDSLVLKVGDKKTITKFLGEGHTKDNTVGYFPSENVLFGGCLLKELEAGKGYLGDANVSDWSATVEKVKKEYPNVKIVIPGHGEYGDLKLLDYTITLFKVQQR
ncbi:CHM family subclass B1 metallo-beta-lactamase [Chryseobacterium sp. BIGb0232]|uniref:CHM family subclass B1 metallo-beta-lactamase n=1 Tax=Chryseobacterium sp. BIGb0232 TaxID=2940598 RepID=UPI000F4923B1|nr:CHM family subclass B1 metallo-beta-lactamase [Chryseobacterium sp. BIGb0232]MCS4303269.1 metallo-beta-lactamase class B [Chryseobacterium sp. BIGb0232]ROS11456.1 metallo-beta-lactamase class B [Chryseobacterium nakagawai]